MKDGIFFIFYEFVRRNQFLNYMAHKIIQSERMNFFAPYRIIYENFIKKKSERIIESPPFLEITLTDICNARCIMCPPVIHTGKTIMSRELFENICREARVLGIERMIITGGEALIDRDIAKKIRFAKDVGFSYVHMFTNGALMTAERGREIIAAGLDSLTWSIDSSVREEYEKIRVGLNFDQVVANMRGFVELRREMQSETPLTRVNMVTLPENRSHRKEFREFFGPYVDIVEIIDSHNFAGSGRAGVTAEGNEYSQQKRYPCHLLFCKLVIWPDGQVRKCSIDYSAQARLGDATEQPLAEIVRSERVRRLKEAHLRRDFSEPGCQDCTFKESWWVKPI